MSAPAADQIYQVTVPAWDVDGTYDVAVGPEIPNTIHNVVVFADPPNQIFLVERFGSDTDPADLTQETLEAIIGQLDILCVACDEAIDESEDELEVLEDELDVIEDGYDQLEQGADRPPTVEDETSIDAGREGPDVVEFIGVDITINLAPGATGNGDDGIGVIQDWEVPEELRFNFNTLLTVSGEKVSAEAQLLEVDYIGSLPADADGSLLVSGEGIIIPDLFDPNAERFADQTFFVEVYAQNPNGGVFRVSVGPELPNQIFTVESGAKPADQVFDVKAIQTFRVAAAQPPFVVEVGPEPPFQIFNVTALATPPDQTFVVTRGPGQPSETFEVLVGQIFTVTTGFATPDRIFTVSLGPRPAPDPFQTFNISVGGTDAPPIPSPDQTFVVTTGVAEANRIFNTLVITRFDVQAAEPPFIVTTSAVPADQTFEVTAAAKPFDQVFTVTTSATPANQVFETLVINEFDVESYDAPDYYTFQQRETATPGDYEYVVSGNGLSFAVNPTLQAKVGQQLRFQMQTSALNTWIKEEQGVGPGEADPYYGDVVNNGTNSGFLYFRPWQVGTYYYQAEFQDSAYGEIVVTGVSADAPDQIFEVGVGIDPDGYNELFTVIVGPEEPDQIFSVTAEGGAPPANKVFQVETGPTPFFQNFTVKAADAPVVYGVQSNGASSYRFNGNGLTNVDNPALAINVGQKLILSTAAAGHPLWIKSTSTTGLGNQFETWADELTNNGLQTGTLEVVFNTPGTYFYVCQFHNVMTGPIVVTGVDDAPTVYAVGSVSDGYSFSGNGFLNSKNPNLLVQVGETVDFAISAQAHPFWIKTDNTIGGYTGTTEWANELIDNGQNDGFLRVTFAIPGTYYYRSQFGGLHAGVIDVVAEEVEPPYTPVSYSYNVASQTGNYLFTGEGLSGTADPALTGKVGDIFNFTVNAAAHPFWIKDVNEIGQGNLVEPWASTLVNNGATDDTIQVVFSEPGTYYYICEFHAAMVGTITITEP